MAKLAAALAANRDALEEVMRTCDECAEVWTTSPAEGKWNPSQIVEHLARIYEESAKAVEGRPSSFPTMPFFVRPLIRTLFFNRTVRNGTFPKAKTGKPFDPAAGPGSPTAARRRLEEALAAFESACEESGEIVDHGIFGRITLTDYVRFQELHTRHHRKQMKPN